MTVQKVTKEQILTAITKLGPVQPIDLRKDLGMQDSFLIGALLSELVSEGKLTISKTRRGGSPFYYESKKPETLENIASNLNEKDRRTFALLKESKVLREDAVDPLVRVGLQNMFDFSRRFLVDDVAYWRYYLVTEDEATSMISGEKSESAKLSPETPAKEKVSTETPTTAEPSTENREVKEAPAKELAKEEAKIKDIPESKSPEKKRAPRKKVTKKEPVQVSLSTEDWVAHDTLFEKVQKIAKEQKATITNPHSIKAHAELTCILQSDGPFGKISLFTIAFNKKKIGEKDIANALLARSQGMPLLFLSVEEISAKVVKTFSDAPNVYFRKL
jgi:hypothetical protein